MTNPKPGSRRCIWCEKTKTFDTNSKLNEFSKEHVLLDSFGKYANTLTLIDSVCADCNKRFGQTTDQQFSRGGLPGYMRFKMHHKKASSIHQFDRRNFKMWVVDKDPAWDKSEVVPTPDGDNVVEDFAPQVGFKRTEGTWLILTETELDKIVSLKELNLPIPTEINFYHAAPDTIDRLWAKLIAKGAQMGERKTSKVDSPKKVLAVYALRPEDQRTLVKMGLSYLAKVCEKDKRSLLFDEQLAKAKHFARDGMDPGYGIVVPNKPVYAYELSSGAPVRQGHLMHIGFYDYLGRNQLIFVISLYGYPPQVVHLCPDFKGVLRPIANTHHWDLLTKKCRPVWLQLGERPIF